LISFFHALQGYYKIYISGQYAERFLNLCAKKSILLWKLSRKNGGYLFYSGRKSYNDLLAMQEKTNTTMKIEGKYGLPFFLYRYRKRKIFFAGMAGCFLFIYILSLFIWDIQILGTVHYTEEEVEKYLEEKEIHTGVRKSTIKCADLEEEIREDFPDVAWVSCDIEGTRFTVHMKESIDGTEEEAETDDTPKDLVASKSGTITSIVTRSGTPMVKKGSKVKQGDTLISGIIYLYNEYDELLETNQTRADGDVKAKTVYQYEDSFPLSYYEKSYTGAKTVNYQISIGDYVISLPSKTPEYENQDKIEETKKLKIGKQIYLPFSVEKTQILEYLPVKKKHSKESAKEKAEKKLAHYLEELKESGIEIVSQNVSIVVGEDACTAKGTITVIESIGKIRKIKEPLPSDT
jgi:similar to stage IV sporulation protein